MPKAPGTSLALMLVTAVMTVGCNKGPRDAVPVLTGAPETSHAQPTSPGPTLSATPQPASQCPEDMVLVDGMYCPRVEQVCRHYLGAGRFRKFSCARFKPTRCLSKQRVHKRFCIDRFEYTDPGSKLPKNHVTFVEAARICRALGKRVCTESEWNLACEGESMSPYPYGFALDPSICNTDRLDLTGKDGSKLTDHRSDVGSYPRCVSPFGAYDMAGNLEELVARDDAYAGRPAMKGSWWLPSRSHCRARQKTHGPLYSGIEVGFRCCADE